MKQTNLTQESHNEQAIQGALTMYKENVSPSETYFQAILSQIPEQQKLKEGRAIRSPYRWLAMTQMVTLAAIVIAVLPSYVMPNEGPKSYMNNPYYETDKQIEAFEKQLDDEDSTNNLQDYAL